MAEIIAPQHAVGLWGKHAVGLWGIQKAVGANESLRRLLGNGELIVEVVGDVGGEVGDAVRVAELVVVP